MDQFKVRVVFSGDNKMLMSSCMCNVKKGGTLEKRRGIRNVREGGTYSQRPQTCLFVLCCVEASLEFMSHLFIHIYRNKCDGYTQ